MSDMKALMAAFADLNTQGIRTYPNHECCGTCAAASISRDYSNTPDPSVNGAVYFHHQDAEDAAQGGGLYLRYGALPVIPDGDGSDKRAVAARLVDALAAHGLTATWGGSEYECVVIPDFTATSRQFAASSKAAG